MLRTENVSGYDNTKTLIEKASADKNFPTAYKAWNYKPAGPEGTTGWFLPTAQQWIRMTMGLGGVNEGDIKWGDKGFDNASPLSTSGRQPLRRLVKATMKVLRI